MWRTGLGTQEFSFWNNSLFKVQTCLEEKGHVIKVIPQSNEKKFYILRKAIIETKFSNCEINEEFSSSVKIWDATFLDQNKILISSFEGLKILDWKTKQYLKSFKNNDKIPFSLWTNQPRNVYLDEDNYVWTSHRNKGVNYSFLSTNNFSNPSASNENHPIEIVSVLEDDNENIWIGSKFSGVTLSLIHI